MHHLCGSGGSGTQTRCCGWMGAADCLRWGRCCYWLIIDRCSFHVYNEREALRPARQWKGKREQIQCEKSTKENVTCGLVNVLVMQNRKIRSKVQQHRWNQWVFSSFFWKQLPVVGLLLLLLSANVLTGCSSAPPPFCSQAPSEFLHILSAKIEKKKKRRKKRKKWLSSCCLFCGELILFKPQEVE